MILKLQNIVPWGRSFDEYKRMFNLQNKDLNLSILDCAGGPSSFNVEMHNLGYKVISCDPIYQFTEKEIASRIAEITPMMSQALKDNYQNFVWQYIKSPEELKEIRLAAMKLFLADFDKGLQQSRYLNQTLPSLNFNDQKFDLALCSHLLFTYSEQLSYNFHLQAIKEMCRVANEVRIFPLLENFTGEISPHFSLLKKELQDHNYQIKVVSVAYEFQKNGNQMLVVNRINHQ